MTKSKKGRKRRAGVQGVVWTPIRCPHCMSDAFSTHHTNKRTGVRYHVCAECQDRFKSIEDESPDRIRPLVRRAE